MGHASKQIGNNFLMKAFEIVQHFKFKIYNEIKHQIMKMTAIKFGKLENANVSVIKRKKSHSKQNCIYSMPQYIWRL